MSPGDPGGATRLTTNSFNPKIGIYLSPRSRRRASSVRDRACQQTELSPLSFSLCPPLVPVVRVDASAFLMAMALGNLKSSALVSFPLPCAWSGRRRRAHKRHSKPKGTTTKSEDRKCPRRTGRTDPRRRVPHSASRPAPPMVHSHLVEPNCTAHTSGRRVPHLQWCIWLGPVARHTKPRPCRAHQFLGTWFLPKLTIWAPRPGRPRTNRSRGVAPVPGVTLVLRAIAILAPR